MADDTKAAAPAEKKTALPQKAPSRLPQTTNPPRQDALPADAIADEPGAAALQELVRDNAVKRAEQGYIGTKLDRTPRENYTLAGVGQGLPTPETTVLQEDA